MIIREGEVPYRMAYKQSAQTDRTGFERIAVVGFGLVGASFAAAVRSVHPGTKMLAVDVDARTLQEAVQRCPMTQCSSDSCAKAATSLCLRRPWMRWRDI